MPNVSRGIEEKESKLAKHLSFMLITLRTADLICQMMNYYLSKTTKISIKFIVLVSH